MRRLRWACLLPFATTLALTQSPQPTRVVRGLYTQVLARHPHSIPVGTDWNAFAPYLSKALQEKFDTARTCAADWSQHSPEAAKDASYDIFTGNEYSFFWPSARSFRIQHTQTVRNDAFRVYVKLTAGRPPEPPSSWKAAAIVVRENGRFVVDDIIYINDSSWDDPTQKPPDKTLSGYLAAGCDGPRWIGSSLPTQPEAFAQSLYSQVIAHAPGGIPDGTDWKIFAPYMSRSLVHRIDLFNACVWDWERHHDDPKNPEKAPFGIFESGMFSGGDEKTGPRAFHVDKSEPQKDSSIRVYVTLKWWGVEQSTDKYATTAEKPYIWQVALVLVHRDNRLLVDDVIFLKDKSDPTDHDYRLYNELTDGCDGRHWTGNYAP